MALAPAIAPRRSSLPRDLTSAQPGRHTRSKAPSQTKYHPNFDQECKTGQMRLSSWRLLLYSVLTLIMSIILPTLYKTNPLLLSTLRNKFITTTTTTTTVTTTNNLFFRQTHKMTTVHHPSHPSIPITLPDGLTKDQLLNFHPFTVCSPFLLSPIHQLT